MPFIRRDSTGSILALFREQTAEARDYLPPTHQEVQAFVSGMQSDNGGLNSAPDDSRPGESISLESRGSAPDEARGVAASDLEMIRVYEDLVDILISKHVVVLTDFPQAAQEKLMRRKRLRSSFSSLTDAVGTEEDEGIFRI